ncbi:trypsin-like serine peptidase [Nocardiopsis lambiniae]|uniref:Trypsin-like serine protease n=1 Tax=Nocardiopsis lambiniae TaxID=3075539 RepID=A0ABU2MI57_9ACTN|nr:trypsin-like serine protease [Nocardiopsis sp. DSM 44743]MDT0331775.1 trypsin-like serine protease [Nocardiopsis sp. DSM 44743]
MSSSTAHKLLAPLAAAAIALGGLVVLDRLPESARAETVPERLHETHAEPTETDGVVRQSAAVTEEQHRAILSYWTAERMAAARPITDLLGHLTDLPNAEEMLPGIGAEHQAAPRDDSTGARWTAGGQVVRTTGKVFLTMDGRDFTCSASVVDSTNRSTVVTAGHCAKDGRGSWARNWTFVPGATDGSAPHGRYTARDLLVSPEWSRRADDSYDFAMVVLNTESGRTVQDRVGSQRISFGAWTEAGVREGVQIYSFGYPAASPYDGRELHYCSGRTRPDTGGTTANGMACRMTQGSSGGPWMVGFDSTTGRGTVASVVSFKYANDRRTQYGPRFGAEARNVYDRAARL